MPAWISDQSDDHSGRACCLQLVQFGGQRSEIVEFFERNHKALEHLLLKNWDASFETMPYPPATGQYALYSVNDLLDYIDFAWANVSDCGGLWSCLVCV